MRKQKGVMLDEEFWQTGFVDIDGDLFFRSRRRNGDVRFEAEYCACDRICTFTSDSSGAVIVREILHPMLSRAIGRGSTTFFGQSSSRGRENSCREAFASAKDTLFYESVYSSLVASCGIRGDSWWSSPECDDDFARMGLGRIRTRSVYSLCLLPLLRCI